MSIFQKSFSPPERLTTSEVIVFPTDVSFYESDHEAVMKSKEMLRIWGLSSWPEDSFSALENKEDLSHHVQDNLEHTAFGYMIYSLDLKTCFGSLYVNPLDGIKDHYHTTREDLKLVNLFDVRLDYWIAQGEDAIERHVTQEFRKWFQETWKIKPLFSARTGLVSKIMNYESVGLKKHLHLKSKSSGDLILYRE